MKNCQNPSTIRPMQTEEPKIKIKVISKTPKDIYVALAKKAIKRYLSNDSVRNSEIPTELFRAKAGCFVSLHLKKNNELRGCIGTILPTKSSLAQEIISNSVSACNDPRFMPVEKKEYTSLKISVDVLSEPELMKTKRGLDPKKYGLIVRAKDDGRLGVLLPGLAGITTVADQVELTKRKAEIYDNDTPIELYRFSVERHEEK